MFRSKRITISAVIILFFSLSVFAQRLNKYSEKKLSPSLYELMHNKSTQQTFQPGNFSVQSAGVDNNGNQLYGVIIKTTDKNQLKNLNVTINSEFKDYVTARVTLDEVINIMNLSSVTFIGIGETLYPTNDIANASIGADLLHSGYFNSTVYKGSGVIVCIIDTGIDWTHLDFRDPSDTTNSRILYIWDETLTKTGAEQTPEDRDGVNFSGLNYGVEYSNTNINDEIDGSPAGFVREEDINGHGTHVAGTAAGNGASLSTLKYAGIAPEADIVVVKAGDGSFSNTNIINALTYAKAISQQLGKPIVVNMSLGGQANPHDGTSAIAQAVDNFVGAGRVAVISAGNDGSNSIHITGSITTGNSADITFSVPSYSPNSGATNDYFGFDTWFDTNGDLSATITSPNSQVVTQNAETANTTSTSDGSVYLYNATNGTNSDREVYFTVTDDNSAIPPANGTWTLTLSNNSGSTMTYHGWLFSTTMGATLNSGDSYYTIGSPGTASSAITVGSFVTKWTWHSTNGSNYGYTGTNYSDDISSFSSIGPRRDGTQKPDIAAPGQAIVSALSSSSSPSASNVVVTGKYLVEQGTSMASPVTAGAAALLLQQNSSWTYSQIKSFITDNANTDSFTGAVPNNNWGYGKLNIFKSMVKAVNSGVTVETETPTYDQWGSSSGVGIGSNVKCAVRFTPSISGTVTGLYFDIYLGTTITSPVYAEIWSDNSGLPNAKLGSTVSLSAAEVAGHSWNYVDMQASGVDVTSGTDYHAVIYWTSDSGTSTALGVDNGSIDSRSSLNTGSWASYGNDLRIRPVISTSSGVLPVELVEFSAESNTDAVLLKWKTATEINNYGFEVERAVNNQGTNSIKWEKIGFVKGFGNSNSPKSYSFNDESPVGGNKLLYRLKQIDFNGAYEYSPEVQVELNFVYNELQQNYPNPFNPVTTIKFQTAEKGKVQVAIYDILGRKVSDLVNNILEAGIHKINFDGSKLASGVYFVKMEAGKFSDIKKIMLLK